MKTEWLLNYVIHYVYPEYYLRVTMCSIKPASVLETLPASAMENVTRFLTPQDLAGLRVLSKKTREVVDDTSHGAFLVYARKMYADSVEKIHDAGLFYARVNILEWLWKTHGDLFFSTRVCAVAASFGRTDVLSWLRDHGCPWDQSTCAESARKGHLETLMWVRERGCPWNAMTCAVAAKNGHLGILDWLRKQDPPAPWTHLTFSWAAWGGQVEVMRWLENNNCPSSYKLQEYAQDSGSISAIKWVEENITAKLTFEPDTNLVGKK